MKILKRNAFPSIFDIEAIDVKPDISSIMKNHNYIGELTDNFNGCDTPSEANNDSTPREIEFVSFNENYSIDKKSEILIDDSNTNRKRKFSNETAKTDR